MKSVFSIGFLFFTLCCFSQTSHLIRGKVTDKNGNPLAFVSIFIDNSYNSTTTNEQGLYELRVQKPTKAMVVYQYLGYTTLKTRYYIEGEMEYDVKLEEENITLNEVIVDKKNNPANEVIRNAIASKKENSESTSKYTADFYSRGIFRIKDAPKAILGQKFDYFDEVLDSTRSGILYLSETVSKIAYQKPDKLKETIVASKVSGNDNGFSFNNAASADFDFYENYLKFQANVVSPIADNAFNYYKFKLEGTFFDKDNHQINKIKVTPKRTTEPAVEGYIYIVEDTWAIYAVDVSIKGSQMQIPAINLLSLKQSFAYNNRVKIWTKNTQTLDFTAGILSVNLSGRFTYVYNNYKLEPKFDKKTFGAEILSFENEANKKDNLFWDKIRPVPLTLEESTDYTKKDILQEKKKSKTYLDSIDTKGNKFGALDVILGYQYKNSYQKWNATYDGILKGFSFNTVQGYRFKTGLSFTKRDEEKRTFSTIRTDFDYGLSEKKLRATASYVNRLNNTNYGELRISGGSSAEQFNPDEPISRFVNSISTLFFKDNYMKLYEKNFIKASFGREIINGLFMNASLDYSERKPLWNTTDQVYFPEKDDFYTSNNPILPNDYETPAIVKHNLIKGFIGARVTFGQQYWTRPDGKFNFNDDKYPVLYFGYEKGFAGNENQYNFDHLNTRLTYDITLGNKGNLALNAKAGKFFNADDIAFVDYKHFNGNRTHIGQADRYLNQFNLMPYYSNSTNDAYFEFHAEHDDKGYIMNKIPLLNKLKSTLVLGYHNLAVPDKSPYNEFSVGLNNLGFGKFKFFRIDYVHSYQYGNHSDGVVFGLKLLNVLD